MVSRQADGLPESRVVLYKKSHMIEPRGCFVVEISTLDDDLFITAFSVIKADSFLLRLRGEQATKALRRMSHDFSIMASCLVFCGNRLQLKSPARFMRSRFIGVEGFDSS